MATSCADNELEKVKSDFIVESLEELSCEDKSIETAMHLYHLKKKNTQLCRLVSSFTTKVENMNTNEEKVCDFVKNKLIDNCVKMYNFMQAEEDVTTNSISVEKLTQKLWKEAENLEKCVHETRELDEKLVNEKRKLEKDLTEYRNLIKEHVDEYGKFKINLDKLRADVMCAKADASILKGRRDETLEVVDEYGNEKKIKEAIEMRKCLEEENRNLRKQLKEKQSLLQKYDSLDSALLMQYNRLKEDVSAREWAMKQFNNTNMSEEGSFDDITD